MYERGILVAIKQLNTHLSPESSIIKEASLMKQLDHPCFSYVYRIVYKANNTC